jgi:hypothetical protein
MAPNSKHGKTATDLQLDIKRKTSGVYGNEMLRLYGTWPRQSVVQQDQPSSPASSRRYSRPGAGGRAGGGPWAAGWRPGGGPAPPSPPPAHHAPPHCPAAPLLHRGWPGQR